MRAPARAYQFERLGLLLRRSRFGAGALVFNRTVTLKDSWAKFADKQ